MTAISADGPVGGSLANFEGDEDVGNWDIRPAQAGFLLSAAVAVCGMLAADMMSATAASAAETVKRGGTLVLARPEEPLSFNPYTQGDNGSIYAIEQVCDSLVEAGPTGRELRPGLAESWDISADGLTYTFQLRDAKFSDGSPVTIDDVVYSWQKLNDPSAAYQFLLKPVKSIEKVDDKHMRVVLNSPYAPFISVASVFAAAIVKKAAFEASPEDFASKPVCAGPFMVESYERGTKVVLAKNPYYWDKGLDGQPLPYLDKVELLYVPDTNARVLGMQNGDYDVICIVPYNQAKAVQETPGVKLEVAPIYRLDYVYLNHKQPPLDDKRIRLALNYAANLEAINKAVYFGFGELPNSINPKMNFWSPDVPRIPYDIAKAKALVSEAGYDGTPIRLLIESGNAPAKQVATILQQGWQEAGLKVAIEEMDSGTAWNAVVDGKYMGYVAYITSDITDDDELLALQTDPLEDGTQGFYTRYKNDEVTKLLTESRASTDPAKRAVAFKKIQEITYNDAYSVPLAYTPSINAYQDDVKGWATLATGWWWLKDVWLDR
jgi:peptide/nickel transport system substrate-binding protein